MNDQIEIRAKVVEYAAAVQVIAQKHLKEQWPTLAEKGLPTIDVEFGKTYARVVTVDNYQGSPSRGVHSFVALVDVSNKQITAKKGDILKASSWKSPAKHARGSVYNDPITKGVNHFGAEYLVGGR